MGVEKGQKSAGANGNPIGCLGFVLLWTTVLGLGAWAFLGYTPRDAVRWGLGGAAGVTGGGCACVAVLLLLGLAAAILNEARKEPR
jgi:hypothetical protein